MSTPRVIIYSTTYCGFCRRAEELLRRAGIAFESIDVTGDVHARAELVARAGGRRTVPVIFVDGEAIGFTGLASPGFMPAVEVGWRLASAAWGNGYAAEAGRAALAFGFGELGLDEIVSFTTVANHKSRRVMEKLGMAHDPTADFEHPRAVGHLRPHVLYRLPFAIWQRRPGAF